MIVSDKFRYVFFGTPHTACTALADELCALYDGNKRYKKHSFADEFLLDADQDERRYFFFAGIRNPLDATITRYLKLKSNHNNMFTDPSKFKENGGFVPKLRRKAYRYLQQEDATFSEYFNQFVQQPPYGKRVLRNLKICDFVIRYENIQEDFSSALAKLGIEQIRPLPVVNRTSNKDVSWEHYYSDEDRIHTKSMYSEIMSELGYSFPDGWSP